LKKWYKQNILILLTIEDNFLSFAEEINITLKTKKA